MFVNHFRFVLTDQQQQLEDIRNQLVVLAKKKVVTTVSCSVCGKMYKYQKAKDNHVKREHPNIQLSEELSLESEVEASTPEQSNKLKSDDLYNYARLRLSMGLLLRNFDDSIKEGDGGRTIRCWKFAMLIFRTYGHPKYALAALQLQAWLQAMLSPRLSHSLIWNRTVNNKGGAGKNIALDLRLEHLNNLLKGFLKNLGPNLTESAAMRCSQAIEKMEKLLESVDFDLQIAKPSGHHKVTKSHDDFKALVKELTLKGDVFSSQSTPRKYDVFKNFQVSLLQGLDYGKLNKWITVHKKAFHKLEPIV